MTLCSRGAGSLTKCKENVSYFIFSFCYSVQLHHSSSLPSILLCQLTTDMPRDGTSTSLRLCHQFMCKSLDMVTQSHSTKTLPSSLLLTTIRIKPLDFLPPLSVERPPHGCWAPLFFFQDQRPRPCTCAT